MLICDKEVARMIGMSPSWVRVQRWKKRTGQEHVFTVAPVTIGTSPRYRREDVELWMATLTDTVKTAGNNDTAGGGNDKQ